MGQMRVKRFKRQTVWRNNENQRPSNHHSSQWVSVFRQHLLRTPETGRLDDHHETQPVRPGSDRFRQIQTFRRGRWQTQPAWENGIRHARMEIKTAIPSFVRVGPHQIMIKYEEQELTC